MTGTTKQEQHSPDFFKGAAGLANYIGVHPRTVRRWIRERRVPFTRVGRSYIFRRSDIRDLLDRNTTPAASTKVEG